MEPRPAAAPAPARASAGASRGATPAASGPPWPRQAPRGPYRRGCSFLVERRVRDPRLLRDGRAHSRCRRRTTFPTRGCVTGRHVRGRRGSSPARPRAQAAGPECRPEARRVHDTLAAAAPRLLAACGAPKAFVRRLTRPDTARIRPFAGKTRGGGPVRRPRKRCLLLPFGQVLPTSATATSSESERTAPRTGTEPLNCQKPAGPWRIPQEQ